MTSAGGKLVSNESNFCQENYDLAVRNFRVFKKGGLRGFFSAHLPDGLILRSCSLHERDGRWRVRFFAERRILPDEGITAWTPDFVDPRVELELSEKLAPLAVAALKEVTTR